MWKSGLPLVIGLILGYLAGSYGFSRDTAPQTTEDRKDSLIRAEENATTPPLPKNSRKRNLSRKDTVDRAAETFECRPVIQLLENVQAEADACREENDRMRSRLGNLDEDLKQVAGDPIPMPENLDPKHTQPELMRSLKAAFQEKNLNAEIMAVDCTEFPCIIAGKIDGQHDHKLFQELIDTEAMRGYTGSGISSTTGIQRSEDEKGNEDVTFQFGVSFFPKDLPPGLNRKTTGRRTMHRLNQLSDALFPRPE